MYLDYNSTHPLRSSCKEIIKGFLEADFKNPSSVHQGGRRTKSIIEKARDDVANVLDLPSHTLIWTSGATEANNMLLKGFLGTVITSKIEHDSVFYAREDALICSILPSGLLDLEDLEKHLDAQKDRPALVSIAPAHHETGIVQPIQDIYKLVKKYKSYLHTDCSQIVGKILIPQADALSLSGHKMGGLAGCGALVSSIPFAPLMHGGGQEKFNRPGMENILGIMTFAEAFKEALRDDWSCIKRPEVFLEKATVVGKNVARLPHVSLLLMPGVVSATQVMAFDLEGFQVSAGSACSSGKVTTSRTLDAMGVLHKECALRVSLGTIPLDLTSFCEVWNRLYHNSSFARTES